jgi:crotonobetainyl-CoA:carnitine CoA-transferase CaiB-like acyl-CoA transferase
MMNRPDARLPLAGLRIADFCWIGAGSYTTKIFGDLGADVIKIESSTRLDSLRLAGPYKDGKPGVNRSGYFADRNTSKRGITIDMKHPRALSVIRRLIERSDIVANNFAAGVMEKFGLGYEDCTRMKPDVIYLAMSMQGRHRHQLPGPPAQPEPCGLCAAGRAAASPPHGQGPVHRFRPDRADAVPDGADLPGSHRQRPAAAAPRQRPSLDRAARRLPLRGQRPLDRHHLDG